MKKYFILYRPFLVFIAKFFLTYIVLTFLYQGFLSRFEDNEVDSITRLVAKNTEQFLSFFNADFELEDTGLDPYFVLIYKQKKVARIIEGCNAVSVIILFISFVVSFSGKLKSTLSFIIGGSLVIYVLNVVRIALLSVLLYSFPQQKQLLHDILFPLFIYGVVFILWVIWIVKFSSYAKKDTKA